MRDQTDSRTLPLPLPRPVAVRLTGLIDGTALTAVYRVYCRSCVRARGHVTLAWGYVGA